MKKEERILNRIIDTNHEEAVSALLIAKQQEEEKLNNGYAYIKCDDGITRLKKIKNAKSRT